MEKSLLLLLTQADAKLAEREEFCLDLSLVCREAHQLTLG